MKGKASSSNKRSSDSKIAERKSKFAKFLVEEPKENAKISTKQSELENLQKWFVDQQFDGLESLSFNYSQACEGTLGCFSKKPIKSGDLLFSVPYKCILSVKDALQSKTIQQLLQACTEHACLHRLTPELLIWLFMIESRQSAGPFQVYLSSLSDQSPNILHWPATTVSSSTKTTPASSSSSIPVLLASSLFTIVLQETNLYTSLQSLQQSLHSHLAFLTTEVNTWNNTLQFPPSIYNYESLLWAAGHYLSRRYPTYLSASSTTLTDDLLSQLAVGLGKESTVQLGNLGCFIPLLDILNHPPSAASDNSPCRFEHSSHNSHNNSSSSKGEEENGKLLVYATCNHEQSFSSISATSKKYELYSSYGQALSNNQLLFAYGYAIAHNPHDDYLLKLKIPSSLRSTTEEGGGDNEAVEGLYHLQRGGLSGIPKPLLVMLKKMILLSNNHSNGTTEQRDQGEEQGGEEDGFVSIVSDEEALDLLYSFLVEKCKKFQAIYPQVCQVLADYGVKLILQYPKYNAQEAEYEMNTQLFTVKSEVIVMDCPKGKSDEDALAEQNHARYIAYYLQGQYEILLPILQDIQELLMVGEDEAEDEEEGEEDDEEGGDEEEDEDE